jgi:hypothetical protein
MASDTLELIEQALDETLQELRRSQDRPMRKNLAVARLRYWMEDECTPSSEQFMALSEMIISPVKCSLRKQLNSIGWLLFKEVKSTHNMKEIAEWVASLDVENYEFRIDALNLAFEGVGEGDDVWR